MFQILPTTSVTELKPEVRLLKSLDEESLVFVHLPFSSANNCISSSDDIAMVCNKLHITSMNKGYIFECQSYPHSLYCGQSEFQPLTIDEGDDEVEKELWLNAWTRVGPCYRYVIHCIQLTSESLVFLITDLPIIYWPA